MTGRGIDQVLPHPSDPALHEPYVQSALEYVELAERVHGPIPKPAAFSYIWGDVLDELNWAAPDARIVNLETSITKSGDFEPKGINYRMHPANVPCLNAAGIECCTLANNHVLDWGRSGLAETISTLRNAGIKTAGAGANAREAWAPAVIPIGENSRVLVFAVGTSDSGIGADWGAREASSGVALIYSLSEANVARIAGLVKASKTQGDLAVLSIHWGGNWGYEIPAEQQEFAHKLIDGAGIDIVHGHSSHHPKGIEVYRDKPVLYGCGDFLNDYEGISGYEEFRSHLVMAYFLTVDPSSGALLKLEMAPFEIIRFQLRRAGVQDSVWLANVMSREGKSLGTSATLNSRNRLELRWEKSRDPSA
jgi:poly-gamma-glutamate capsule biosynthesis protein CapA/YwtB (metallophosphatase superfamily)